MRYRQENGDCKGAMSLAELSAAFALVLLISATVFHDRISDSRLRAELHNFRALQDGMHSFYDRYCGDLQLPHGGHREFQSPAELFAELGTQMPIVPSLETAHWNIQLFNGSPEYGGAAIGRVTMARGPGYDRENSALANYSGGHRKSAASIVWHFALDGVTLPGRDLLFQAGHRHDTSAQKPCHVG